MFAQTPPRRAAATLGALLAALLLFLTGCGTPSTSTDAGGDPGSDSGGDSGAAGGEAFPVTVKHKYGSTTVDEPPKRVVTLGYTDHDPVLALGVEPVGLQQWIASYPKGVGPFATGKLGKAKPTVFPAVAEHNAFPFEKTAALRPDLIVVINKDPSKSDYEKLSRIAPTIAPPKGFPAYGVPWQRQTAMIGKALGKPDEARKLVASLEKQYADQKAAHPEFAGKTAVVAMARSDGAGPYTKYDARMRSMLELGFEQSPKIAKMGGKKFNLVIGKEQLDLLDADVLVVMGPQPDLDALRADPLFQRLPVVREKRTVVLDEEMMNAFSHNDVLSIPWMLDRMVPKLSEAAKRAS